MEKFNYRGKKQERNLLITNKAVYNLESDLEGTKIFTNNRVKRRIPCKLVYFTYFLFIKKDRSFIYL